MSYGAISYTGTTGRRDARTVTNIGAALGCIALAILAIVSSRAHAPSELMAKNQPQAWSSNYAGESVPVPTTVVNYRAGTRVHPHFEYENSAMDKARPVQLASVGGLKKRQSQAWSYAGDSVPVPTAKVNYRAGTSVHPHSEFENSAMDKARPMQLTSQHVEEKHGLSAAHADQQFALYFAKQAKTAARKVTTPSAVDLSASAAEKQIDSYFKQQAVRAERKPKAQQIHRISTSKVVEAAPKFGLSAVDAAKDIASYFTGQTAKAAQPRVATSVHHLEAERKTVKTVRGPKFGMSAGKAEADLSSYFTQESALAAKKRHAAKLLHEQPAPKGKAPKFGLSARAASQQVNQYFARQQRLMGTLDAKDHKDATIQYVGDIPVDKELDRPLWGMEDNKLPDHLVDADKADCTENIDCESTRSPLLFKSKAQKLSAYGVGAEHDNALELGKAVGVDASQDSPVIQANAAPTQKTIDEVNNAIDSQRGDRYTNGNGMPVEKVELPAAAV